MTQAVVSTKNTVSRSGFSNPLTLAGLTAYSEDDLVVYADTTLLVSGVDYSVQALNPPSVEIIGAEDSENYVGVETFTILYSPPLEQGADLGAGGGFGGPYEEALDRLNLQLQVVSERVARAPKVHPAFIANDARFVLDDTPPDGGVMAWDDAVGRFVWSVPAGQGLSAYEVAVDNGFVGDEAAWLLSLVGAPGTDGDDGASAYEIAVTNGFVGDEAAWLLSLVGAPGNDGDDGASAYEVAVANGYVGDEAAWLLSLVGAPGTNGDDGASAYEVAVANGFVGDEAAWLLSLVGAPGNDGDDGIMASIVQGTGIDVDATDPANPVVRVEQAVLDDIASKASTGKAIAMAIVFGG